MVRRFTQPTERNSTEMTVLFLKLYDQYPWVFMNYVFLTFTESTETLKNCVDYFHAYIFMFKPDMTLAFHGTCYFQHFCNKIVIPTILSTYNSASPIMILPGIAGDEILQLNYFTYPDPLQWNRTRPSSSHSNALDPLLIACLIT